MAPKIKEAKSNTKALILTKSASIGLSPWLKPIEL